MSLYKPAKFYLCIKDTSLAGYWRKCKRTSDVIIFVNGQDATQPVSQAPVDKFAQPLLVTESPTSIALASQATTTVYAGRHLHGTA
ncbi:hypothetical protein MAFF211271_38120 (plasmid) [Ralstonia syzygii subsp. indonesiensis]|nr:hypothetical protein MAFF211271_38120 [Ralstonia pseudosolanacearum]